MTGRMERDADAADRCRLAVGLRFHDQVAAEAAMEERTTQIGAEISAAAWARVVAVRVGDQRPVDGTPGIDIEAAGLAEQAGFAFSQHVIAKL